MPGESPLPLEIPVIAFVLQSKKPKDVEAEVTRMLARYVARFIGQSPKVLACGEASYDALCWLATNGMYRAGTHRPPFKYWDVMVVCKHFPGTCHECDVYVGGVDFATQLGVT